MAVTDNDISITKVIFEYVIKLVLIIGGVTLLIIGSLLIPPNATLIGFGSSMVSGAAGWQAADFTNKVVSLKKERKENR